MSTQTIHPSKAQREEIANKRQAEMRTRDHILWLVVSLVLTVGLTFIPAAFFTHFGPMIGGSPLIITEIQNFIHRW